MSTVPVRTDARGASGNIYRKRRLRKQSSKHPYKDAFSDAPFILRFVLWGFLGILIVGGVLAFFSVPQTPNRPTHNGKANEPLPPGTIRQVPVPIAIDSSSVNPLTLFALIGILAIALPLTLWVMLFKRDVSPKKRLAGGLLAAGLSLFSVKELSGALLKELKIDALVKIESPFVNVGPRQSDSHGDNAHFSMGRNRLGALGRSQSAKQV
ncbi:MAG: hypothetical protein DMG88_13680 [Acidobacteria bacterium]|nr:MAG: hypothetical protein DMG88_13680 [Acidobacteriota bacterium]